MNSLYLASGSPRRRELLTQIGVPFTVVSPLSMKLLLPMNRLLPTSSVLRAARRWPDLLRLIVHWVLVCWVPTRQ